MNDAGNRPVLSDRAAGIRKLAAVLAIGAAGVLAGVGYVKVVHPTIVPKNFGVVEEGVIYRSGELTPSAIDKVVREKKIKTIIDLGAHDKDPAGERVEERTATALGVERRVFRLEGDGRGNPNAYVEALRIMTDPSKKPVLVHCSAGSERTSGCVLLYRKIVQGKPMESQWHEAYEHRHDPKDNPHLKAYLDEWAPKIEAAFKAGHLVEGQPKAEIVSPAKVDKAADK